MCLRSSAKQERNTYTRFFEQIVILVQNTPEDILFNFERAAMNAIGEILPNVEVKGCFYHHC